MKMLVLLFRITQVKASKKVKQELSTKKKKENGETETKRDQFNNLRMPKLQETLSTVLFVIAT